MKAFKTARSYSYRVRSMTEDVWHVILVPEDGHVICSCAGVNWCSHIDATLIAGERAMVPEEERGEANRAQIAARGRLQAPEGWQAHWRSNRKWRGLPPARITMVHRSRKTGKPVMSIEGRGNERRRIAEMSQESGWLISPRPVAGCLFHIAPNIEEDSSSKERARQMGIPIASYSEWDGLAAQLAEVLSHEIQARSAIM